MVKDSKTKHTYKRVPLDLRTEDYAKVKTAAEAKGESVNGYIKKALESRLRSEGQYITFTHPRACDIGKYGIIFRYTDEPEVPISPSDIRWCKEDDGTRILYKSKDEAQWRADMLQNEWLDEVGPGGDICEHVVREYKE